MGFEEFAHFVLFLAFLEGLEDMFLNDLEEAFSKFDTLGFGF